MNRHLQPNGLARVTGLGFLSMQEHLQRTAAVAACYRYRCTPPDWPAFLELSPQDLLKDPEAHAHTAYQGDDWTACAVAYLHPAAARAIEDHYTHTKGQKDPQPMPDALQPYEALGVDFSWPTMRLEMLLRHDFRPEGINEERYGVEGEAERLEDTARLMGELRALWAKLKALPAYEPAD